jgi:hypothetical protein
MPKKMQGKSAGTKKGARDHFMGTKYTFLESKASFFQESVDSKSVTTFYDKITSDFIKKFGLEEPFHKEPTDSSLEPEPVPTTLSGEALTERTALFTKLRQVS